MIKVRLLLLLFLLILPSLAVAQEGRIQEKLLPRKVGQEKLAPKKEKNFTGRFVAELYDNYTYESTNVRNEFNENFARLKLDLKYRFSPSWYLKSNFRLTDANRSQERARRNAAPDFGDDQSFENQAIYLKEFNLNYEYKNATFSGGKYQAIFGQAFNRVDSIWIFNEARTEYRQNEKLGFTANLKAGKATENGRYLIGFSSYVNDRYLDRSIITKKDEIKKSAGTPGDKLSYLAFMNIDYDFGNKEKLSYHLSYLDLGVNERASPVAKDKIEDPKAYALNINYQLPLNKDILGEGFIEYANFSNNDGNIDADASYLTTSLAFYFFENYSVTFGRFLKKEKEIGTNGVDHDVKEVNLGYQFDKESPLKDLKIMVGIKRDKTDNKTSKVVDNVAGLRAIYTKEF